MKKLFLIIIAAALLCGSALFAAQNHPDAVVTLTNLKTNVTVGSVADLSVGIYRDTLDKEAATANEMDTTILVDKIYIDPLKYTGFSLQWRVTAASYDSVLAAGDTVYPMLWNSYDGTNWTVLTGSTEITQDTVTSTTPALAMAIVPSYKAYYTVDGTLAKRGRYWRIGVRYVGSNEDATNNVTVVHELTMARFKN